MAAEVRTLGFIVKDYIEAHAAVPDGEFMGEPLRLQGWQEEFVLNLYRIRPDAAERYLPDATRKDWTRPSRAFHYDRGGQLVAPQKTGKGPFAAAWVIAEAAGPVLFDGWAERGDVYTCADHGCSCGWEYRYEEGEPRGRPWATPWIEITAVSEDQTANVWRVLLPMIREGRLEWPDVGETRINLPGGGVIKPVTASARSRLGARITAAVEDEAHDWNKQNGGRKLADNQRRNLAGMGGRFLETGNAWDPSTSSVAEDTYTKGAGVYKQMAHSGEGSIRNMRERKKMIERVYTGSWWVDPDRISSEIDDLIKRGEVAQAERFFLNRIVPGEDRAVDPKLWKAAEVEPHEVPDRTVITIGVDGARYFDALAIIATDVATGYQWPLGIWERPSNADDTYEHPLDEVDGVMTEAFERYLVWRAYVDPGSQTANISNLVEKWQGRWTEKRVVEWLMSRPRASALMVGRWAAAVASKDATHPSGEQGLPDVFTRHVENARRKNIPSVDEDGNQLWTVQKEFPGSPLKIDSMPAAALSWEARGDAISSGVAGTKSSYEDQLCRCPNGPQARDGTRLVPHIWKPLTCPPRVPQTPELP